MFRNFLIAGLTTALLAGCGQAVNDARLTMARQELREQCFGNDTYSCRNKTIDFNIMVIKLTPFKNDADKAQVIQMFGKKGWDVYEKVVDEFVEQGEEIFDSARPNIFARWFMGDSQPASRKGYVMEYSPQDMVGAGEEIQRRFLIAAKKEGLKLTDEGQRALSAAHPQTGTAATQAPDPAPTQTIAPDQVPPLPGGPAAPQMEPGLSKAIANYTAALDKDGGAENSDLRQVVRLDLNNDDVPDAAVLYVIEGEGGAQAGYTYIAGFFNENGKWRAARDRTQIGGAIESMTFLKPGIVSVDTLTVGPDDPDCCPSVSDHSQYVWNGEKFVELPAKI
jgi:hypothetical protein